MQARGLVDLLIPRGGAGLIRACVENAAVPVIETGTGICHLYEMCIRDSRRNLQAYLQKTDIERYRALIAKLGLRK